MTKSSMSVLRALLIPIALMLAMPLTLIGDQLLFEDDFSDGSAKDWQVDVGVWYVGGGSYCVADCGS